MSRVISPGAGSNNKSSVSVLTDQDIELIAERAAERGAARAIAEHRETRPALLDRSTLAHALSCSVSTIIRAERDGMPRVNVGEAPRYDLAAVLSWLRSREGAA